MAKHKRFSLLYFLPLFILLFLILIFSLLFGPQRLPYKEKILLLEDNLSGEELAQRLYDEGLIWDKMHFLQVARAQHLESFFKGGEYFIKSSMGVEEIVHILKEGEVLRYRFVIPEGTTIKDMAEIFSRTPLISLQETASPTPFINKENFLKLAAEGRNNFNNPLLASNNLLSLEGYLFPSTYELPRLSEEELIEIMIEGLENSLPQEWLDQAEEMGWSIHEVLTLASMIEKEAMVDEERPIISSVFHNRLALGMRMECDPTVEYALGYHKSPLSYDDLTIDSPYNTYLYPGLPPGPICNPGLASIKATLYPAQTDYLYFVAKGDGQHLFAKTYDEHLANIEKLRGQ